MTNFCANCGSELNESQMCLCQTQPIEEVEKEIDSEVNYSQVTVESDKKSIEFEIDVEKIKNYLSRLFGCLVSGIKRPITTFEYLVKNQSFLYHQKRYICCLVMWVLQSSPTFQWSLHYPQGCCGYD